MGCWFSKAAADTKPPPFDFQRNGPLRYLGYAGHIGAACRSIIPSSAVYVPQMVSTAYILGDVWHRTAASSEKGDKPHRVAINAFDALIWQLFASVFIPGLVINGLKTATKPLLASKSKGCPRPPSFVARFLPCALAILAIPLISTPIDKGVDFLMNSTYRSWTAPTEEELKDPRTLAKEAREREEKAAKAKRDAEAKAKAAAKKLEQERLEKERKARELEKKKCDEEAKAAKAKKAEEERILKEQLKKEEKEFKEKQSKLEKEFKEKASAKMECK